MSLSTVNWNQYNIANPVFYIHGLVIESSSRSTFRVIVLIHTVIRHNDSRRFNAYWPITASYFGGIVYRSYTPKTGKYRQPNWRARLGDMLLYKFSEHMSDWRDLGRQKLDRFEMMCCPNRLLVHGLKHTVLASLKSDSLFINTVYKKEIFFHSTWKFSI